jgi:hypothetical protein
MLASGISALTRFRDEAAATPLLCGLGRRDGGEDATVLCTRTWRTRCKSSGGRRTSLSLSLLLAQRCVQTIGMAVRNYFVMRRVRDGHDVHIRIVIREVQTVWRQYRRRNHEAEMKQLSQAEGKREAPALFTHEARHAGLSPTLLLTGMPDAVEVLGGMSKGRCRRRCRTSRTRGMYYLCCM